MQQEIQTLLTSYGDQDEKLVTGVTELADRHGDAVYREMLWQLVGKAFPPEAARETWDAALERRRQLAPELGLRPALLDYLQQIARSIRDPRILEASLLQDLRQASVSDGLTGLFNQTHFKLCLERLLAQAGDGRNQVFAVILLDLDRFKEYNDRCGHLAGDRALSQVAATLLDCVRQGDLAARYGGEEFALLLHRVDARQTHAVADRVRRAVADRTFEHQQRLTSGNLTISAGFALSRPGDTAAALLERADRELYRAKKRRNTICPAVDDTRRSARRPLRSMIEYAAGPADGFQPALSFDISPTGLSLGCDQSLEPGATVQLRFRRPFWPREQEVQATVRHVRPEGDSGLLRIGLEFLQPQPAAATGTGAAWAGA